MKIFILEDLPGLSINSQEKFSKLSVAYCMVYKKESLETYDGPKIIIHFAIQDSNVWDLCDEISKSSSDSNKLYRVFCGESVREQLETPEQQAWCSLEFLADFEEALIESFKEEESSVLPDRTVSKQILSKVYDFETRSSEVELRDFGSLVCDYFYEVGISNEVYFVDYDFWQMGMLEGQGSFLNKRRKKEISFESFANLKKLGGNTDIVNLLGSIDEQLDQQEIEDFSVIKLSSAGGSPVAFLVCRNQKIPIEGQGEFLDYLFQRIPSIYNNKKIQKEIIEQSYKDDVTELYNQKYLPIALDECVASFQDAQEPFSVLFIDVDFFKKVNDTQGHIMGSRILCELGEIIFNNTRDEDFAFRYGGDEFLIILRNTASTLAESIAERLRKQVESHIFSFGNQTRSITISIGIAACPEHAATKEDVIELADQAMYYGKNKSRNIVYVAS